MRLKKFLRNHLKKLIIATAILAACGIILAAGGLNRAEQLLVRIGLMAPPAITEVTVAVPGLLEAMETYYNGYLNGIRMAEEDIAAMEMPVTLNIQVDDDLGDFTTAVALAQSYIEDPAVIGVVGHLGSAICLPLSSIYTRGRQTMVVPTVSVVSLTAVPSDYVFRNIPADGQISEKMCTYAVEQGVKRAVIFYEDTPYGFEMSSILELYAQWLGIEIVDRVCSPDLNRELSAMERKWRALEYDAVFLISNFGEGLYFIDALRELGFGGPVICSHAMDVDASVVREYLSADGGGIVISSIVNSERLSEGLELFYERYRERFGMSADVLAIQSYDSVMIVAEAVAYHHVRTSDELAAYLTAAGNLGSIFGVTSFDRNRDIVGKAVYLKKVTDEGFEYIDDWPEE